MATQLPQALEFLQRYHTRRLIDTASIVVRPNAPKKRLVSALELISTNFTYLIVVRTLFRHSPALPSPPGDRRRAVPIENSRRRTNQALDRRKKAIPSRQNRPKIPKENIDVRSIQILTNLSSDCTTESPDGSIRRIVLATASHFERKRRRASFNLNQTQDVFSFKEPSLIYTLTGSFGHPEPNTLLLPKPCVLPPYSATFRQLVVVPE